MSIRPPAKQPTPQALPQSTTPAPANAASQPHSGSTPGPSDRAAARGLRRPASFNNLSEWGEKRLLSSSSASSLLHVLQRPSLTAGAKGPSSPATAPAASSAALETNLAPGAITVSSLPEGQPDPEPPAAEQNARPAADADLLNLGAPGIVALRRQASAAAEEQSAIRYFMPRSSGSELQGVEVGSDSAGQFGVAADRLVVNNADVGGLSANRNGLTGNLQVGTSEQPLKLLGMQVADATLVGVERGLQLAGGGQLNLAAYGIAAGHVGGAYVGASLVQGPLTLAAGAVASLSGQAGLELLEKYVGDDPARTGKWLVQWRQQAVGSVGVEVAGNLHTFGVGGRAMATHSSQALYRLYLQPEQIGAVLRQQGRSFAFVQSALQGLKLKKSAVALPKVRELLNAPERGGLLVGESMTFVSQRVATAGLSPGAYGLRAGAFGTLADQREITFARTSTHVVEVTVAPKRTRSGSLNVEAAVLAEAFVQQTHAQAQTQSMTFDLRDPAAREALQTLLDPGDSLGRVRFLPALRQPSSAHPIARAAQISGVALRFAEHAERPERRLGIGMPAPKLPLVSSRVGGISRQRITATENSTVYSQDQRLHTQTFSGEQQTQLLHRGTLKRRAQASVYRSASSDSLEDSAMEGVIAQVSVSHNRVVGDALNRSVRPTFAKFSDEAIAPFARKGRGKSYEASVQRFFSAADIAVLADVPSERIEAAATAAGIAAPALKTALRKGSAEALAAHLKAEQGLPVAAAHHLLGGSAQELAVETSSDATTKALQRTLEFFHAYDAATLKPGSKNFKQAQKRAEALHKRLGKVLQDVNDDQVLRTFDADKLIATLAEVGKARDLVQGFLSALSGRS